MKITFEVDTGWAPDIRRAIEVLTGLLPVTNVNELEDVPPQPIEAVLDEIHNTDLVERSRDYVVAVGELELAENEVVRANPAALIEYSSDDVVQAVRKIANSQGLAAARQLLDEFGAARAGDVPENRRAEFIARAQ